MSDLTDNLAKLLTSAKDSISNQYQQGDPVRQGLAKILSGDISPLNDIYGKVKQLGNPSYMKQVNSTSGADMMDVALNANPMMAGTIKALTPFEMAHATAQKNAVDMLGLNANNTAMERAKAMGFDTPAYHGTDKSFNEFNPSLADSARKTGTPTGSAVVTSEPQTANTYGQGRVSDFSTNYNDGANLMPLMVRKGNNLSMNATQGGYTPNWNDIYSSKYPNIETTNDFANLAKSKGKDSATIKNVKDNARMSSAKGDTTFLFNPNQLRSKFAAFDPAKAQSSDLLGFADPRLLAGVAGVTGGGLLGANYLKGNK